MKKTKQVICGGLGLIALTLLSCNADSGAAAPEAGGDATAPTEVAAAAEAKTVSLKVTGMT